MKVNGETVFPLEENLSFSILVKRILFNFCWLRSLYLISWNFKMRDMYIKFIESRTTWENMTFKVDTLILAYRRMEYLQNKDVAAGLENVLCICISSIILLYFFQSFFYVLLHLIFTFPWLLFSYFLFHCFLLSVCAVVICTCIYTSNTVPLYQVVIEVV